MVTGAAGGIGRASARRMASEGASVFCVDLDREAVEATVSEIVDLGGEASAQACDVADEVSVRDSVKAC